jgi:molecular chaperone DnaK (HSP70)
VLHDRPSGELAVDFGTSNTVAAVRDGAGSPVRLLCFQGSPVLPSAVWLAEDGELVVGGQAERQAKAQPARFEPNPKLRIDDGEVQLGDTVFEVPRLIAAVLSRVAAQARRELGGEPSLVVLTHPADWRQPRRNTLREAARLAGWASVRMLAEPVAAAAHFGGRDMTLAVCDMGGGTTDTALLRHDPMGWRVLTEAGADDFGGADIEALVLEHIRRPTADRPEWAELLRPSTPEARCANRALLDDVRDAKEALSRHAHSDIPLPDPLPDAHLTRAELEQVARPRLRRTVELLATTVGSTVPDGIYLVGGASRMPLVAQLITARFGIVPAVAEAPETCVALGALLAPPREEQDAHSPGVTQPVSELSRQITQRVSPSATFSQLATQPVLPRRLAASGQFPVGRKRGVAMGLVAVLVLAVLMVIVVLARL